LGNINTQTTLEKESSYIHELSTSTNTTQTHIDKAAKYVIDMIDTYQTHAQTIWPMTEQAHTTETNKLRPPITKADTSQIQRLTKLRNEARQQEQPKHQQQHERPPLPPESKPTPEAKEILQLTHTPNKEDIPSLCNKAIAAIISKAKKNS
jgi:hypothetical protein